MILQANSRLQTTIILNLFNGMLLVRGLSVALKFRMKLSQAGIAAQL